MTSRRRGDDVAGGPLPPESIAWTPPCVPAFLDHRPTAVVRDDLRAPGQLRPSPTVVRDRGLGPGPPRGAPVCATRVGRAPRGRVHPGRSRVGPGPGGPVARARPNPLGAGCRLSQRSAEGG